MPNFRGLPPDKMNLPEIQEELEYQAKRLYRLRKLQRMGKDVQPDMDLCEAREAALDFEERTRLKLMTDIPF